MSSDRVKKQKGGAFDRQLDADDFPAPLNTHGDDVPEDNGWRLVFDKYKTPPKPSGAVVQLQLPIDKYVVEGPATGRTYTFLGNGSSELVDVSDAPGLLAKTKTEGCCGSPTVERRVFTLINYV